MQPVSPCLAIDYGAASTQAVLCRPDGWWMPVPLDGERLELSSAIHYGADGAIAVGQAAWRRAADDPGGFVLSPSRRGAAGAPQMNKTRQDGEPSAHAPATQPPHPARAPDLAGGPVQDVRLVVPAGWGPRRHQWLRQAARQAGLGVPRLTAAPVAAGQRLLAAEAVHVQIPVGAFLLIGDLGAGAEMSVLRRGPHGLEILSTIAEPDAGGAAADEQLLRAVHPPQPGAGMQWIQLAAIRAAREALSQQATVTVAMPPDPPIVLSHATADQATAAVWNAAGQLAARAVEAAELTVADLAAVYLIGGVAGSPSAVHAVQARLGATGQPVQPVQQPTFAAVLGAADAGSVGVPAAQPATPPPAGIFAPLLAAAPTTAAWAPPAA
ncbi:hypothetical protein AB0M20_39810, partial [Actinoplanes sp. NPDC051633]|uniref:hypothetical protein n=1 Tax=Actinoplanes sp. NPDC051633 TaxID=3155670 RepID=UPI0034344DBB